MTTGFGRLMLGAFAPWRGLRLIVTKPRVRKWSIVPLLLAAIVITTGFTFGIPFLTGWLPALANQGVLTVGIGESSWLFSPLYWLVLILSWPVSLFALLYALLIVSRLVAAPFYSILAERALIEAGALEDQQFHLVPWIRTNIRLLGVSLAKVMLFSVIGFVLFFLSFIPGLGILTAFGFLLIAAFDSADASFEALQMGLNERLSFFRAHFIVFVGMAITMGLVFLVPGLNFFLLPATVVGASDVVRRLTVVKPD